MIYPPKGRGGEIADHGSNGPRIFLVLRKKNEMGCRKKCEEKRKSLLDMTEKFKSLKIVPSIELACFQTAIFNIRITSDRSQTRQ